MIVFSHVSIRYDAGSAPVLRDVDLTIDDGDLALVVGRTGAGKSTLLGAINGHVPHFTGGVLNGRVTVDGLDTATHPPRELADRVGVVAQDPLAGFVTDTVEEELAYGMEQLGVPAPVMRTRVEETLDILGLAELRGRALRTLSGGQQQRVAIGAVLAAGVRTLVLDEPTSELDPVSAEEVLSALTRLVDDLGLTVVIAEHRLERVLGYAHRLIVVDGGVVRAGPVRDMLASSPLVPPVVELARVAGLPDVPLTVREARRMASPLVERLAVQDPSAYARRPAVPPTAPAGPGLAASRVRVEYGPTVAVADVSLALPGGTISVIMGRNGSGKSSLLWALAGAAPLAAGRVSTGGVVLAGLPPARVRSLVRLVPQTPADLLFLGSVADECAAADRDGEPGRAAAIIEELAPGLDPAAHPDDLSEGQKLAVALAVQMSAGAGVLLLDEPTRGLDYPGKAALAGLLAREAAAGRAIGLVTHDVEFAAAVADAVVVMAGGEVIATGAPAAVLGSSALFASQVAKVLHPRGWLTPYQVAQALEARS